MAKLPVISGDECVKALERLGYYVARTKGDHVRLRCSGRNPVTDPKHKKIRPRDSEEHYPSSGALGKRIPRAAMS